MPNLSLSSSQYQVIGMIVTQGSIIDDLLNNLLSFMLYLDEDIAETIVYPTDTRFKKEWIESLMKGRVPPEAHLELTAILKKVDDVIANRNLMSHMRTQPDESNTQLVALMRRGRYKNNRPALTEDFLLNLLEHSISCASDLVDLLQRCEYDDIQGMIVKPKS